MFGSEPNRPLAVSSAKLMFEIKARKNFKPQYTSVFEDFKFCASARCR